MAVQSIKLMEGFFDDLSVVADGDFGLYADVAPIAE